MKGRIGFCILAVSLTAANRAAATELYERAGWVADLPLGFHDVEGRVTIVDERTLHVEHFDYDGGGPAVYFYLGEKNNTASFINGLALMPLLTGTVFNDDTLTLTLPPGETLDGYGAISVWCEDFNVSFSSASFVPPAGPRYERAGWEARLSTLFHQVAGTATIIDDRMLLIESFTYDGTAPAVYFYLGGNHTQGAFLTGLQLEPQLDRAYSNETVVVTLPDGESMDSYTAISVWCALVDVNFGSAIFRLYHAADVDDDGDVDGDDYVTFADCLGGPDVLPVPGGGSPSLCLNAFDHDTDGDVDVADYAALQSVYTGPPAATALYELVFDATWSAATHPQDFPGNPHFSGLVGGTHNDNAVFWEIGGLASPGIESMAETGSKTALIGEVNAEITAGDAGEVISGGGIGVSPGSVTNTFTAAQDFPLATVVSMIAPSPDWFVGVDGYQLFRDNQWTPEIVIELDPYDAGTDSGPTYTSPNQDTQPQDPIQVIIGYPFQNGGQQAPLGTFTFRRID